MKTSIKRARRQFVGLLLLSMIGAGILGEALARLAPSHFTPAEIPLCAK